ncbi:MAG: acyl carrier protein [Chromatiales bacterium]|jgi:acyl carrier protein
MSVDDRSRVRAYIQQLLSEHDDHTVFDDTTSLIKSGRLDSLAVTHIVMFLETTFDVDFAIVEFDPERLDSVAEILALIEESRASS